MSDRRGAQGGQGGVRDWLQIDRRGRREGNGYGGAMEPHRDVQVEDGGVNGGRSGGRRRPAIRALAGLCGIRGGAGGGLGVLAAKPRLESAKGGGNKQTEQLGSGL